MKNGLGIGDTAPSPWAALGRGKLGERSRTTQAGKEVSPTHSNTSKGDRAPNLDFYFDSVTL